MAKLTLPNGHGHGWRPDVPDHRDKLMRDARPRIAITSRVALQEEHLPPVRDQSYLGSCTGHGVRGALLYKLRQRGGPFVKPGYDLSPLYAYYQARVLEASVNEDAGAEIRDVVKAAFNKGVATEDTWPYDISKFKRQPTATADKTARWHQVKGGYYRCLNVDDIMLALASDIPPIIGFSCFSNLDANGNGHIPLPGPRDRLEGGHCVWVVAADPATRELKFQNSWSEQWGDQGYGYLPFDYLDQGLADDMWAVNHE